MVEGNIWAAVSENGPECETFKIDFLVHNSSLGLVDDTQSENIGERLEYMP